MKKIILGLFVCGFMLAAHAGVGSDISPSVGVTTNNELILSQNASTRSNENSRSNSIVVASLNSGKNSNSSGQNSNSKNRSQQIVKEALDSKPSSIYRFERHYVDSVDGKRRYRIQISIPKAPAPKSGYRAIYMLDGNAAMATLTEADAIKLNSNQPTVLIAIGYNVETRNDPVARAYDYTPPVYENGQRLAKPVVLGKEGGGAGVFLNLLRNKILPLVNKQVFIDSEKSLFWGHSYGGLFVLYTISKQPDMFSTYVAADPSVWWYNGAFADDWHKLDKSLLANMNISILSGTKPRLAPKPYEIDAKSHPDRVYKDPSLILQKIISDLSKHQSKLHYITYPDAGHGDMINKSLEYIVESDW